MQRYKTVDAYLDGHPEWLEFLQSLRKIMLSTNLEETIKWGAPVYTFKGKNIVGLGAFKSYVGIWFFQGGLLKDTQKKLMNAQEGKTKAMRQWRFKDLEEIDEKLIRAYVSEAIQNQKEGKQIKPIKKTAPIEIPIELERAFTENSALKTNFDQLSPSKQREYAEHIAGAKREATRVSRLEKSIPLILEGKGLYDKYKNC